MNEPGTSFLSCFATPGRATTHELAAQIEALAVDDALGAMLDALPSPVLVLNPQRQAVFGNAAMRATAARLGTAPIEGQRPGEILACRHVAAAPAGCGTGKACRDCGAVAAVVCAVRGGRAVRDCSILTGTGQAMDLRLTATPVAWGGHDFVLAVLEDVSAEKRREILERTFLHDLLNVAGGVAGMASWIAEDPSALGGLKDDLVTSSSLLVDEIRGQRTLLEAERGDLDVRAQATSARRVLADLVAVNAHHPVAVGRRLTVHAPVPDVAVWVDAVLLARVLGNLVKNALEASAPGEEVSDGLDDVDRAADTRVAFYCHNAAVIPPSILHRIFQRNVSTKGAGRGIGTYGARLITQRYLGGDVEVASDSERGTRFTVRVPRAVDGVVAAGPGSRSP